MHKGKTSTLLLIAFSGIQMAIVVTLALIGALTNADWASFMPSKDFADVFKLSGIELGSITTAYIIAATSGGLFFLTLVFSLLSNKIHWLGVLNFVVQILGLGGLFFLSILSAGLVVSYPTEISIEGTAGALLLATWVGAGISLILLVPMSFIGIILHSKRHQAVEDHKRTMELQQTSGMQQPTPAAQPMMMQPKQEMPKQEMPMPAPQPMPAPVQQKPEPMPTPASQPMMQPQPMATTTPQSVSININSNKRPSSPKKASKPAKKAAKKSKPAKKSAVKKSKPAAKKPANKGKGKDAFGMKDRQHVVKHNGDWAVKKSNAQKATKVFKTQKEAIDFASKLSGGAKKVTVHSKKGAVRKK